MSRSRVVWIEMVGLLPSSVLLGPLLGFTVFMIVAALASLRPNNLLDSLHFLGALILLAASALAGQAGGWAAVLIGADRLRQWRRARWIVVVCLLMGLGAAVYWESSVLTSRCGAASTAGWIFWCVLLVPTMLVAVHQLYLLLCPR